MAQPKTGSRKVILDMTVIPSAPPLSERGGGEDDIPVAHASLDGRPPNIDSPHAAAKAVQPGNLAAGSVSPGSSCPPGMVAKSVTTTYPDGRTVTVTEYVPLDQVPEGAAVSQAPVAASMARPGERAAPAVNQSAYHPPRRDLGTRPATVTCPYCQHTGKTRINHNCGDCSECFDHQPAWVRRFHLTFLLQAWISIILLLLCCFPLFWIPLICPSCQDVEHSCSNCGRLVGKSNAECCNK